MSRTAINLFPHWSGPPLSWMALSFWWSGAVCLGTSIFTLWNTATATTLPLPEGDRIVAIQINPVDALRAN